MKKRVTTSYTFKTLTKPDPLPIDTANEVRQATATAI